MPRQILRSVSDKVSDEGAERGTVRGVPRRRDEDIAPYLGSPCAKNTSFIGHGFVI